MALRLRQSMSLLGMPPTSRPVLLLHHAQSHLGLSAQHRHHPVDEYVFYGKRSRLLRRVGNMSTILAMLIGLPFTAFLVISRSAVGGAGGVCGDQTAAPPPRCMAPRPARLCPAGSRNFSGPTCGPIARSGTFALSEHPSSARSTPITSCRGHSASAAPIIILEATFRIFRPSASVIYTGGKPAILAIPGQTRALAARDASETDPHHHPDRRGPYAACRRRSPAACCSSPQAGCSPRCCWAMPQPYRRRLRRSWW